MMNSTITPDMFDDIYTIWEPYWYQNPWVLIGIASLVVLFIFIGVYIYRRQHLPQQTMSDPERIVQAINALPKQSLSERDFYGELTRLLKAYISYQKGWQSLALTDEEFIEQCRKSDLPLPIIEAITTIYEHAAVIKYAHETINQRQEDYERSLLCINILTSI